MRKILIIVQKEFKQIFRDKMMKPILFIVPIVQLAILSYTADFTVRNINAYIVDNDHSTLSKTFINKLSNSENFHVKSVSDSYQAAMAQMDKNNIDVIVSIPQNFHQKFISNQPTSIYIAADAINGTKAGISINYLRSIIKDFINENFKKQGLKAGNLGIELKTRHWYNPNLDYKFYMVPGILALLVTIIALFLSGMNIVKEKEVGTIEQINVTPIKKHEFIIGKLLPFLLIGLFEFSIGLLIAILWFKVPILGSFALLYLFTFVYLILILGVGMFISTVSNTQQQALLLAWFLYVIFLLMSGLLTPIESMPNWAQTITLFNPVRYYVEVIRLLILKGSHFSNLWLHFIVITGSAILINLMAIWNYKKTS
ncbi:MAG TPA: ABC transporter permease [Flavobacteriales bacterium]|jgi:ABC-2 type transport system permease protein|nr:ABC transporter permease [Flavobacteriales bacterium]